MKRPGSARTKFSSQLKTISASHLMNKRLLFIACSRGILALLLFKVKGNRQAFEFNFRFF